MLHFRCWQLAVVEKGGWQTSVRRPTPRFQQQGVRAFIDRVGRWCGGATCRNSIVISNDHLQLVFSGLTSIILVVLGKVNLQFREHLFPFLCGQFSELWQLKSWVQSGHHVVTFSTWCFGICTTAPRLWLRILPTALEKELKILDYT